MKRFVVFLAILLFVSNASAVVWCDLDFSSTQAITLKTSDYLTSDITTDYVILIDMNNTQTNFWANVQSDGSDVRFFSSDCTEYDYYFELFDDVNESMVAWVEVTDTFPTATNLDINIYYKNGLASDNQSFKRDVFPDHYIAAYDFNFLTGTTEFDVVDTNTLTLANGPLPTRDGQANGAIAMFPSDTAKVQTGTLLEQGFDELTIMTWIAHSNIWDVTQANGANMIQKDYGGGDVFQLQWRDDGSLLWRVQADGGNDLINTNQVSWTKNQWYNITATFSDSNNAMIIYSDATIQGIRSDPMNAMPAVAGVDFQIGAAIFDANMDRTVIFNKVLTSEEILLLYQSEAIGLQEFGIPVTIIIDLNITTINGVSFKTLPTFSSIIDGNITAEFNVFNSNNDRMTIDLNYSVSVVQGTGTVIIKDLNLTSSVCSDQDWGDVVSTCSYSFDFSAAADGNYTILGLLAGSDFNAGDGNFEVLNDVNIVVLPPIDEDTGLVIPSSPVTGFSVKITTDDDVRFFDDMIDLNGFVVSFQLNPIILEVDINVTGEYFSRQYSLTFDEVVGIFILQPFLAPQASSGNFIFAVVESTTLNPIEGVTITIEGVVPGGGAVEIQEIITDSAGLATIPLVLGSSYDVTFTFEGEIVHTATIIPTAASLFYQVALSTIVTEPTVLITGILETIFSPTINVLEEVPWGAADINVAVSLLNRDFQNMFTTVRDSNGCVYDTNTFTAPWTDGNTINFFVDLNSGNATNAITGLPCIFDSRYALFVTVDVNSTDGNTFSATSIHYTIIRIFEFNLWRRLDLFANTNNVVTTSFIAFFITMLAIASIAFAGVHNPTVLAILTLAVAGFFVFFGWLAIVPFIFMVVATIFFIFASTAVIGS